MRLRAISKASWTWCGQKTSTAWAASRKFLSTRDLLGDDNLAEIVVHIRPDYSRKVYVSKLQGTPDMLAKVVESVVRSGTDLGHQHGVTLNLTLPMAAQNPQGQWIKDAPTPLGIVLQFQPPGGVKP